MNKKSILLILCLLGLPIFTASGQQEGMLSLENFTKKYMVLVAPGEFFMGENPIQRDEQPAHKVKITRSFYMAKFELTFELYDQFSNSEPNIPTASPNRKFRGRYPAVGVSWAQALLFCNWLSQLHGLQPVYTVNGRATTINHSSNGYRIPTEAEWEFAARGGIKSKHYIYSGGDDPDQVAWFRDNSKNQFHPVGTKKPNELGIFDMSGNAWEWCWDWYLNNYYQQSPESDPMGPLTMPEQVLVYDGEKARRGGFQYNAREYVRISYRSSDGMLRRDSNGFRIMRYLNP